MISHRAGPLPPEEVMETPAGNAYRLKRGRQRQRKRRRGKTEKGNVTGSDVRLEKLKRRRGKKTTGIGVIL